VLGSTTALLLACSGGQGGPPDGGSTVVSAESIASDCLDLLATYQATDHTEIPEAELERQMAEAKLNEPLCSTMLEQTYRGRGGAIMAAHLGRTFGLHALEAELTLSMRFDEMAGYCEILEEIVHLLDHDLTEIDAGLPLAAPDDLSTLLSLRELTGQTLQVSIVDYAYSCY
jgi:hypothetical protein